MQVAIHEGTNVHTSLFAKLMENTERNCQKTPKNRRFTEVITKFATSFLFTQDLLRTTLYNKICLHSLEKYHIIKDGEFRFQELLQHLNKHKCTKIVSVGKDATRLISRVNYDSTSDQLVGFILPVDSSGLPKLDSFNAKEKHFSERIIAKYSFSYVVQPLRKLVPTFILACLSSDNQFTAENDMQKWKYIHSECAKLGIDVVNFGADGDSREMKSMRVSCHLQYKPDSSLQFSPSSFLPKMKLPKEWMEWFALKYPTSICYVQDTVHIAVKMKSRLLKPSIVLPLGKYTHGNA